MEQQNQPASSNSQIIAVISYITLIGWIVAYLLYQNDKSELAIYHMRQSLGILILGLIGAIVFWIPIIGWLAGIFVFVLWLMGLIYAAQSEKKPIPLLGNFFQDLFKGIQ